MIAWNTDMALAPQDGTEIRGKDETGAEAVIRSVQTHPKVPDMRHWSVGGYQVQNENWKSSQCFYPIAWRPV